MLNKKSLRWLLIIGIIAMLGLTLAACAPATEEPTEEPMEEETEEPMEEETEEPMEEETEEPMEEETEEPMEEETEEPMGEEWGTEDNPIIMSFVPSQDSQEVLSGAEEIGAAVSEITGYVVETNIATEYAGVITAMCNGEAQVGALNTFGYVLAHEQGCADVALASVRFGSTSYSGQLIVRADSGIENIEDLAGKTFCRPDPLSTSGWIIPSIAMRAAGVDPDNDLAEIVDAGGHDAVVQAVYNGDCDAGSTFVDARSNVEDELTDVKEQVVVILESPPIPNDTISYASDLPQEVRDNLTAAFLQVAEEQPELLDEVYSWGGLTEVDDSFYDPFRQTLDAAGLDITDLVQE